VIDLSSAWVDKDTGRGAWETPRRARGAWSDPARATVAGSEKETWTNILPIPWHWD